MRVSSFLWMSLLAPLSSNRNDDDDNGDEWWW